MRGGVTAFPPGRSRPRQRGTRAGRLSAANRDRNERLATTSTEGPGASSSTPAKKARSGTAGRPEQVAPPAHEGRSPLRRDLGQKRMAAHPVEGGPGRQLQHVANEGAQGSAAQAGVPRAQQARRGAAVDDRGVGGSPAVGGDDM